MRIVVHGQQAFGKAVLEALLERGDDVVAVYAAPEGKRPDPLAEAAAAAGLPLVRPASFRDPAVVEGFRALAPDLQVMAFVTLIVPQEFLSVPTLGTIQFHPSLLPRHRGRSAINWPVIKGETETGITVFWPDGGIDTGDVLLQRATPIAETTRSAPCTSSACSPWGWRRCSRLWIWSAQVPLPGYPRTRRWPRTRRRAHATTRASIGASRGRQLHDLIRGCDPAPGAWTSCGGQTLQIFAAAPQPARDVAGVGGAMGEVASVGEDGFSVVCADGRLSVTRVRPAGGAKQGAGEWAAASGLVPGARFE